MATQQVRDERIINKKQARPVLPPKPLERELLLLLVFNATGQVLFCFVLKQR